MFLLCAQARAAEKAAADEPLFLSKKVLKDLETERKTRRSSEVDDMKRRASIVRTQPTPLRSATLQVLPCAHS